MRRYLPNVSPRPLAPFDCYEDLIYRKYKGKVLVVDVDDIDYLHSKRDFSGIIDKIDAHLFGLF